MSTPVSDKRRAMVTGAASGIGRSVVMRLVAQGTEVTAVDRDANGLKQLESDLVATVVADLGADADRDRVVRSAPALDYLVNAAAILAVHDIFDYDYCDFSALFAVNVQAVWELCARLGPRMVPGGAVVNVSSSAAKHVTATETALYAASKAAVLSLTRSFARALAERDVRVNAVCPFIVETPMQTEAAERLAKLRGVPVDELHASRAQSVPLGRIATPDDLARVIHFLLSDDASYMTGQSINVTGGLVTW